MQAPRFLPIPGELEREASRLGAVELVLNEALECLERMGAHWFGQSVQLLLGDFWAARFWPNHWRWAGFIWFRHENLPCMLYASCYGCPGRRARHARCPVFPAALEDLRMATAYRSQIAPGVVATEWWRRIDGGRLQCDVCPRYCKLHEGQKGFCFVREVWGEQLVLSSYARASGFCIDPRPAPCLAALNVNPGKLT